MRDIDFQVVEPTRESAAKWAQQWSKRPGEAYGLDPDEDGVPSDLFVNGVPFAAPIAINRLRKRIRLCPPKTDYSKR